MVVCVAPIRDKIKVCAASQVSIKHRVKSIEMDLFSLDLIRGVVCGHVATIKICVVSNVARQLSVEFLNVLRPL